MTELTVEGFSKELNELFIKYKGVAGLRPTLSIVDIKKEHEAQETKKEDN